jgi:hypothetical protein
MRIIVELVAQRESMRIVDHLVEFEFDYSSRAGFIHAWAFS